MRYGKVLNKLNNERIFCTIKYTEHFEVLPKKVLNKVNKKKEFFYFPQQSTFLALIYQSPYKKSQPSYKGVIIPVE